MDVGVGKGGRGGGFGWDAPPPMVPLWSPSEAGQKFLSLNPLGAEAKSWLSASNIGRGGGGGGAPPPPPACTAILIHDCQPPLGGSAAPRPAAGQGALQITGEPGRPNAMRRAPAERLSRLQSLRWPGRMRRAPGPRPPATSCGPSPARASPSPRPPRGRPPAAGR